MKTRNLKTDPFYAKRTLKRNFDKLKRIDIVFENCEAARISGDAIDNWGVYDIRRVVCSCNCDEVHRGYYCRDAFIIFNDLKNLKYKGMGFREDEESLYERLTHHQDVTHFDLVFELSKSEYVSVPWGSDDHYYNAHQILKKTNYKNRTADEQKYILEFTRKWNLIKIIKHLFHIFKIVKWKIRYKFRIAKAAIKIYFMNKRNKDKYCSYIRIQDEIYKKTSKGEYHGITTECTRNK
jgi:hypothetical protein